MQFTLVCESIDHKIYRLKHVTLKELKVWRCFQFSTLSMALRCRDFLHDARVVQVVSHFHKLDNVLLLWLKWFRNKSQRWYCFFFSFYFIINFVLDDSIFSGLSVLGYRPKKFWIVTMYNVVLSMGLFILL